MYLNVSLVKIKGKDAILSDFEKLLKDNSIDEEEFQILKSSLNDI